MDACWRVHSQLPPQQGLCPTAKRNYSRDRTNLGHARGAGYLEAMATIYAGCFEALRHGGFPRHRDAQHAP